MRALHLQVPEEHRPFLRLGTCSWKYDSWKGIIYREGVDYGPFDYLPDYARCFNMVEVDQWFWGLFPTAVTLPDAETVRRYAESVPDDFLFSVKVPNAITLTHFYANQHRTHREYANRPNEHFLSIELFRSFLATLTPMASKLGPLADEEGPPDAVHVGQRGAFGQQLPTLFGPVVASLFLWAVTFCLTAGTKPAG